MIAVIKTGGKQYVVKKGTRLRIEKLNKKDGSEVIFKDVLLRTENKKVEIGKPKVKEAKVTGKLLQSGRAKKILVIKYKNKTRYRRKIGHRQDFSEVEITSIV